MSADEIYQAVTDRMIQALERGVVPWRTPWTLAGRPRSMSTGSAYRGVNTWLLSLASREHGWRSPWFGTYQQIQEQGSVEIQQWLGIPHATRFSGGQNNLRDHDPCG